MLNKKLLAGRAGLLLLSLSLTQEQKASKGKSLSNKRLSQGLEIETIKSPKLALEILNRPLKKRAEGTLTSCFSFHFKALCKNKKSLSFFSANEFIKEFPK